MDTLLTQRGPSVTKRGETFLTSQVFFQVPGVTDELLNTKVFDTDLDRESQSRTVSLVFTGTRLVNDSILPEDFQTF